jgi:uncharacterized protein with HEPN domain
MSLSHHDFLKHILDECRFILTATKNKNQSDILADEILSRALVRSLEIIGEATKCLDPEFRNLHPQVEWKKMSATRDVMIHVYFGIDYDIVWNIISEKIPELEFQIDRILSESK